MPKNYLDENVLSAALNRMQDIFDIFPKVYLAFSGGKDSTVMLHLALQVAELENRLPLDVLFVDLEGQYDTTIRHIEEVALHTEKINLHWICLPLNLRNSVSVFQPHWRCWDPQESERWIRPMPKHPQVISDIGYYPFFHYGMEFEDFVYQWGNWFSDGELCSCMLGIRSDESLNRFFSVTANGWGGENWMSKASEDLVFSYPIYDWRTEDIWRYVGKQKIRYNKLYDYFYLCGISIHKMRICQPYGEDQRQSLAYFHEIEPETWSKVVARVHGVNFGAVYSKTAVLGRIKVVLPDGLTWKKYTYILLRSMPEITRLHYTSKIETFLKWWENNGFPSDLIPDQGNLKLENAGKLPSWRRICKCIIKNDWWCRSLGFTRTKKTYETLYVKEKTAS
ncbi:DUF3440 domain-containing protein [Muricauda sp. SCSIO 64092]|uniref:DUF3440 domain-containing protein n=1 Tax=Allomuricauda sp. SCSIO 64092 TaxID=2908842 RepID=UPI001FF2F582|nr:DUF3440 domain-containing protein [Muricauda sp. SCSIO 64092]UOY07254.1 DUF3440 domain-containing protein [Muricauda sp. SCSIO 64092]